MRVYIETYNYTKFVCYAFCAYGRQSYFISVGVTQSNYLKPKIEREAKFNTDCSCCTRNQGKRVKSLIL